MSYLYFLVACAHIYVHIHTYIFTYVHYVNKRTGNQLLNLHSLLHDKRLNPIGNEIVRGTPSICTVTLRYLLSFFSCFNMRIFLISRYREPDRILLFFTFLEPKIVQRVEGLGPRKGRGRVSSSGYNRFRRAHHARRETVGARRVQIYDSGKVHVDPLRS